MAEQKQPGKNLEDQLYLPAPFYMVRAPALSAQVFTQLSNAGQVHVGTEVVDETLRKGEQECAALLLQLAERLDVRQALAIASPSLLKGLERLLQGTGKKTRETRLQVGLLRYLTRMSTRPTPFGLFAGVGVGRFAQHTDLCLGETAIAGFRTRPDMHWLLSLLQVLEKDPGLVAQLKVRLNQTAYLAGGRARLPFADTYGAQDTRAISLRATAVVRTVFALAQQSLTYAELQAALQEAFPRATSEQVERVLWQLWEHGFLISELHPPLTNARPGEYVLAHLDALQGADELKTRLARVLEGVSALDRAGIGAPVSMIAALVQDQEKLAPAESKDTPRGDMRVLPLQVDSALQVKAPFLHGSIGQAAARAATFLLRTTPLPTGSQSLQEYRLLFLEKYGEQAEVPLLDLLSPENGLDAPPGYRRPPRSYERPSSLPPPTTSSRDQVLLRLVTDAVNQRSQEVELTEEVQRQLERWSPKREDAPLSLEIYLQIHARSCAAIDRGEWTAVIGSNCGSQSAGRSFGRFFDLLGEQGIEALRDLAAHEEALLPDVIFAELSYQPWQARQANVAVRPPLRAYEIAIGTTPSVPSERVLPLSDLVVGIHHGRFTVRSLRLGKQVRVGQSHMLNSSLAPNVCRFLTDIANDGFPLLSSFDWGFLTDAPFLPRLVIKIGPAAKLVITPAGWRLQAETILPLGEGSAEACWFRGLQQWRTQWRVPRYVYLVEGDNRLLLDLENPLMAAQLRENLRMLKEHTHLTLDELLPDFAHLWLHDEQDAGYFSEIVVPLLRADALDPASSASRSDAQEKPLAPRGLVIPHSERQRFPGEEWIYLKLYAALSQHEELLAGPMREVVSLLQERQLLDRWFFIRYNDPEPHLRLRFRAQDMTGIESILALTLPWGVQLARNGLIQRFSLDTYEREVERYGGPEAIDVLEQVFTVDSTLVSNLVASRYEHRLTLDSLAVAVFTLDHFFTSWGCTFQRRLEWARQASEKYAWSSEYHADRKRYCDLLAPGEQLDASLAEQRALLRDLVRPLEALFGELGAQVHQLAEAEKLWIPETSLLGSLAHMHLNRLLGIDRNQENQVYAFWRHTLDSLARRHGQSHDSGAQEDARS
jgi:thiopeptide-type bacteriocin biosynthesis protein